jgi:medium-chain acyl-[acyl-carrier-protein] hydrolase
VPYSVAAIAWNITRTQHLSPLPRTLRRTPNDAGCGVTVASGLEPVRNQARPGCTATNAVVYTARVSVWVPPYVRRNLRAEVKLFCFPYAGAGASIFRLWGERLGDRVELLPIQLPGRENRFREPYPTSISDVADALVADRALPFEGRFVFFGHSLGTLLAYEVAQRLRSRGRSQPARLIMSAHRGPQVPLSHPPTWNLAAPEFERRLKELNGTPIEVFENGDLMDLIVSIMRADLRLDETYVCPLRHEVLSCPISVFGGTRDAETPLEHLDAWRDVTTGVFERRMFEGDHFFIRSSSTTLIEAVASALRTI